MGKQVRIYEKGLGMYSAANLCYRLCSQNNSEALFLAQDFLAGYLKQCCLPWEGKPVRTHSRIAKAKT